MFVFGHVGLTSLTVRVIEKVTNKKRFDYRLLVIGSLLPDLIDKPIGRILFQSKFESGRIYAHTLAFILLLLCIGLYRWLRFKKIGWLILAGGSIVHDIFDQMWMFPRILSWPLLSLSFNKPTLGVIRTRKSWVTPEYHRLITDPYIYLPEIIGFIVIVYFIVWLFLHHRVLNFIRTGKFE